MAVLSSPDRRAIPYLHWQCLIGRQTPNFGDVVTGEDDIHQAIWTIILTEKGSVPGEPEKCIRLLPWIDRRADVAIPNIVREITDALTLFEPRIVVTEVAITAVDLNHWRFPVLWYPVSDIAREVRRTVVVLPEEMRP